MLGILFEFLLPLLSGVERIAEILLVLMFPLLYDGPVASKCRGSEPPRCGRVASCCDCHGDSCEARGYYWTGTSCAPDACCECDSTRPGREWGTLRECERAHRGCAGAAPPHPRK